VGSPSVAIGRVSRKPRTLKDSVIRLRAVNAVLDEYISKSGRVRDDPTVSALRDDIDVAKTLSIFEHELAALRVDVRVADAEWALADDRLEFWKAKQRSAETESEPFFVQQALAQQQQAALLATEKRLELEEWEQLVADYSAVIAMLKERLSG
jgi:hypothetical protein